MNLENKIKILSFEAEPTTRIDKGEHCVLVKDAIKIAKEYAEEEKIKLLNKIIQDSFNVGALTVSLPYLKALIKELATEEK